MKRLTREEVRIERLLRAARSVAVVGARRTRGARGSVVVDYLKEAGFDVFPVRKDRAEVAGIASWARVADVPGSFDILLVLGGDGLDQPAIEQAARKRARIVWFAPGARADDLAKVAASHGLVVAHDMDIVTEHRHTEQAAGQPRKRGVNIGGRKGRYEDDRTRRDDTWHVDRGGGGRRGGGGQRAVVDEKKMVGGKPSPRRGPARLAG